MGSSHASVGDIHRELEVCRQTSGAFLLNGREQRILDGAYLGAVNVPLSRIAETYPSKDRPCFLCCL